jgi:hypothetical protein
LKWSAAARHYQSSYQVPVQREPVQVREGTAIATNGKASDNRDGDAA